MTRVLWPKPAIGRPRSVWTERLGRHGPLSTETMAALEALGTSRHLPRGAALPDEPCFIAAGWAIRTRLTTGGHRAIMGFLLPGDPHGLDPGARSIDQYALEALTPLTLVSGRPLVTMGLAPDLAGALERATWAEVARLVQAGYRAAHLSAAERVADLLLELHTRLLEVGLASPAGFDCPATQRSLGEATALSAVHINRTLKHLQASRIAEMKAGRVRIMDRCALERLASGTNPGQARVKVA